MRTLFLFLLATVSMPISAQVWLASVEPVAMVAREVLGDSAQVNTLLLPNQTPHFAAYTPGQLQQLRDADVLVWLGEEVEPHLSKLVARRGGDVLSLLSLSGVEVLDAEGRHQHEHDDHHAGHEDASLDPHVWLSHQNMLLLAREIAATAVSRGAGADEIDANLRQFENSLSQWRAEARTALAPVRQEPWLTQHNPWRYLQADLGIADPIQVSAALQSGISSRQLVALRQEVTQRGVTCVISEPEAKVSLLETLCPDCRMVRVDPLGRDFAGSRYTDFLRSLSTRFGECLAVD